MLAGAAEEALTAIAGKAGGRSESLPASLAALESMTDEQGRPILDQTDDEGVPLRQRLDEARRQLDDAQLERVAREVPRRSDGTPALENLGGLLRGLLGSSGRPSPPGGDEDDRPE